MSLEDRPGRRHGRTQRVRTRGAIVGSLVVALAAMAACSDGETAEPPAVDEPPVIDARAYSTVVDAFLPETDGDERPVVWIAQLGSEPLSLDDQVDMIAAVEPTHDLRFVDDPEAAVGGEDDQPRDDGLLLGIGEIRADAPHTVRVEVFVNQDRIRAELLTLVVGAGGWQIDTREIVDPEDLVVDE